MSKHRTDHKVKKMCEVLNISRSAYYKWTKRRPCRREEENDKLKKEISYIFRSTYRSYGVLRITAALRSLGYQINKKRVERLKKELGLKVKKRKRYKKHKRENVEVNILQQDFTAEQPNTKWVSDITETGIYRGKGYICVIMDLYSRYVVSFTADNKINTSIITSALYRAEREREVKEGMLFHSDKGPQYTSEVLKYELKTRNILQSMSGTGNCYDNAAMESFFSTLKREFINKYRFMSIKDLIAGLREYIYYYNNIRLHSTLGYLSPNEFERIRGLS